MSCCKPWHYLLLALGLSMSLPSWAESQCRAPADRYQALEQALNATYSRAADALGRLPEEAWSITARQEDLGGSVASLYSWVRDETRWLPYSGKLRGSRGALIDRSGSHLDRALLLHDLLEAAGHRVRLARASLEEEALEALEEYWFLPRAESLHQEQTLDEMTLRRATDELGMPSEALRQALARVDRQGEAMERAVRQRTDQQTRSLWALLEAEAGRSDVIQYLDEWQAALSDHWWVQVREGDDWLDLDPALPGLGVGERLHRGEIVTLWTEDIPDEQLHRLTLEVVAERLESGGLRERTALEVELEAAQAARHSLVLDLQPLGLPSAEDLMGGSERFSREELPALLSSREEWLPLLMIGDEPVVQHSILDDGGLGDPEGGTGVGEAFSEAAQVLGSIGTGGRQAQEEDDTAELTAVWLRLHVAAPGREIETFQRPLMDILGAEQRQGDIGELVFDEATREARALSMLSTTELLAQGHWWSNPYTAARLLGGLLDNRMAALGAVHAVRRDDPGRMGLAMERLTPYPAELFALAYHRHGRSEHRERLALTRLNLLSTFERLVPQAGEVAIEGGLDIIDNRVAVLPGEAPAIRVRLAQGVLDTVLEAELHPGQGRGVNTSLAYAEALEAEENWQLVDSIAQLPEMSAASRGAMAMALSSGQVVVMPENPGMAPTWWRLDPVTGDALGMGPDGRGQMVEQVLVLMNSIDNAASAVEMVQAVWSCILTKPSPGAMQCCILREGASAAAEGALGKLADQWVEIAKFATESKIYLAALDSYLGEVNSAIVEDLMPDPC
ncbi:hypothetical protein LY622_18465 [Halomonas sp. M5N1S17]|uniref:hypothetical protein n=1 Tax=Halomonas alkalisoli TaxID=2907158 RepID=UPI001F186C6D|nr:hypothetical protein [Halomonas alkalisoli]MCE9665411.1 hypothetical protein [Halomonas alkalisoli]